METAYGLDGKGVGLDRAIAHHFGCGAEKNFLLLKVHRQCPLVHLVEAHLKEGKVVGREKGMGFRTEL
jgi:hypothetical protein